MQKDQKRGCARAGHSCVSARARRGGVIGQTYQLHLSSAIILIRIKVTPFVARKV